MSWGAEALQRAVHCDGEVAAAELVGVAWRGEQGSNARGSGSRRSLGCRVGRWAKQEVACGLHGGGRSGTVPAGVKQRGRQEVEEGWTVLQFRKIQGPYYKSTITFKLGLK